MEILFLGSWKLEIMTYFWLNSVKIHDFDTHFLKSCVLMWHTCPHMSILGLQIHNTYTTHVKKCVLLCVVLGSSLLWMAKNDQNPPFSAQNDLKWPKTAQNHGSCIECNLVYFAKNAFCMHAWYGFWSKMQCIFENYSPNHAFLGQNKPEFWFLPCIILILSKIFVPCMHFAC